MYTDDGSQAGDLEDISVEVAGVHKALLECLDGQTGTLDKQALQHLNELEQRLTEIAGNAAEAGFDDHIEGTLKTYFEKAVGSLRTDQVVDLDETAEPLLADIARMLADTETLRDAYFDEFAKLLDSKTVGEVLAISNASLGALFEHEVIGDLAERYIGEVSACNAVLKDKLAKHKTLNRR